MYRRGKLLSGPADMASIMDDVANISGFFTGVAGGSQFATDFLSAQNPLSQGGIWLNGAANGLDWLDFQASNNVACAAAYSSAPPPPYNDCVAVLKPSAFNCTANQFAQGTVFVAPGYNPIPSHELGLFVRANLTAHSMTGYEAYVGFTTHAIVRWNGALNDFTPLFAGSLNTPSNGSIVRLEVIGSTIAFYQDGVFISGGTDTTFATGQPGMQSFCNSPNTFSNYGYSSWHCGNL